MTQQADQAVQPPQTVSPEAQEIMDWMGVTLETATVKETETSIIVTRKESLAPLPEKLA